MFAPPSSLLLFVVLRRDARTLPDATDLPLAAPALDPEAIALKVSARVLHAEPAARFVVDARPAHPVRKTGAAVPFAVEEFYLRRLPRRLDALRRLRRHARDGRVLLVVALARRAAAQQRKGEGDENHTD